MATLAQNIQRAINDFNSIENAIVQKGVDVPDGTPTSEYGEKILSIESGVDTSGDTVVPSALREGYTAHNAEGQAITGTIPDYSGGNTVEMTSPDGATLNTAGTYCEGDIEVIPKLQSKTATTGEIVTADAGYVGLESVDTTPVFEAGQKSEYDAFWDAYQQNGERVDYLYAFSYGWSTETFNPKYPMAPEGNCDYMFYYSKIGNADDPDFDFVEKGIELDLSKVATMTYGFAYARGIKRLGVIDFTGYVGYTQNGINRTFWSTRIETIDKLVVADRIGFNHTFDYTQRLKNLTIEGTIGQNGFNASWSPLDKESLTSLVNILSSTTTGLTVTLRLAAVNTAFETTAGAADGSTSDEWTALIATKPNWTINLINS